MRKVELEIKVNGNVSEKTFTEIVGNILEHVENENKFWQTESMLSENQEVTATVIGVARAGHEMERHP